MARVVTPENIEFEYALAGPFQRLPAFAFDLAARVLIYVAIVFVLSLFSAFFPVGGSLVVVVALLLFFFLSWFYGIYFETRFNGRTLGKMLFKLRVISVDGRPINATQAALRNLLRLADMALMLPLKIFDAEAPPAYIIPTLLVGLVTMTITRRFQRVGDLAAGTMVVSEYGKRSPWNQMPEDPRAFGLSELIPATFQASSSLAQTIGLYMENRRRLSQARRQEVSKHLAVPLIERFGLLPDTSYDLLLCALYTRIFLSADQRARGHELFRDSTRGVGSPADRARAAEGTRVASPAPAAITPAIARPAEQSLTPNSSGPPQPTQPPQRLQIDVAQIDQGSEIAQPQSDESRRET